MNTTYQIYSDSNTGIYFEFLAENLIINTAIKPRETIKEEDIAIADIVADPEFFFSISLYTMNKPILLFHSHFFLTTLALFIYCTLESLH